MVALSASSVVLSLAFGALTRPPIQIKAQAIEQLISKFPVIKIPRSFRQRRILPDDSDVDSIASFPGKVFNSQLGYGLRIGDLSSDSVI